MANSFIYWFDKGAPETEAETADKEGRNVRFHYILSKAGEVWELITDELKEIDDQLSSAFNPIS